MTSIDTIIDQTWEALRGNLFRRAILGRRRCAELVMHALASFPDRELAALKAHRASPLEQQIVADVDRRIVARFRSVKKPDGIYGRVFSSIVLRWSSSAIIRNLVSQWRDGKFDAAAIRTEYGWK